MIYFISDSLILLRFPFSVVLYNVRVSQSGVADKISNLTTAIIHAQMSHSSQSTASQTLRLALKALLRSVDQEPKPDVLWIMSYTSHHEDIRAATGAEVEGVRRKKGPVLFLKPQPPGLVFEDSVLDDVRSAWERITKDDADRGEFMQFEEREAAMGEDEPEE